MMKKIFLIFLSIISIAVSLYLFFGYSTNFYGLQVSNKIEEFSLVDQDGNEFSENNFKNKHSLVFFGYTKCYTVCPVSMRKLEALSKSINSPNLQIIYISIDPSRDDLESLKIYINKFGSQFVALNGTKERVNRLGQKFRIQVSNVNFGDEFNPQYEHSGHIYFVDSNAEIKMIYPTSLQDIAKITQDIQILMEKIN
ncbi:MAG: SCO family protein [Leptospiraceae bacterium]|nr:SCO family protein [Leptospiraceae bacterium]